VSSIIAAWQAHEWLLFTALIVGAVVSFAKQGWLGGWLAAHLPPAARPYLAMALGFFGTVAGELCSQPPVPLVQALLDGVNGIIAGMIAIAGHQVVIEGMRGGKEIVGKWGRPPSNDNAGPPANAA